MSDREKLVELIAKIQDYGYKTVHEENVMYMRTITAEELADYLLAHGVTVREPQKPLTVEAMKELWGKAQFRNCLARRLHGNDTRCKNMDDKYTRSMV